MDTFSDEFPHCLRWGVCLLQHDHSLPDILTTDFLQSKAGALSSCDKWDIDPLTLDISDRNRDKVVSIIWSLITLSDF